MSPEQTPLTVDAALVRLGQYREHAITWSTASYNDDTERALYRIAEALAAEIERLRAEVAGRVSVETAEAIWRAGVIAGGEADQAAGPAVPTPLRWGLDDVELGDAGDADDEDDAPEAPPACGKCRRPFDETDRRHDGHARAGDSPWCRRCVDRCHESTDFAHECVICREPDDGRGGERDWQYSEQLAAADPQDIAQLGRDIDDATGGEGCG